MFGHERGTYQKLSVEQSKRIVQEFFPENGDTYKLEALLSDLLLSYVTRSKAMEYGWLYESYKGDTCATNRLEEAYGVIVTEHVNRERARVTVSVNHKHFARF